MGWKHVEFTKIAKDLLDTFIVPFECQHLCQNVVAQRRRISASGKIQIKENFFSNEYFR